MGSIDKRRLQGLMQMMGGMNINPQQLKMFDELSNTYSGKSEEEIIQELTQLNKTLGKDKEKYIRQMEALAQMKDFLSEEQQHKLDRIIEFLNKEENQD
jgi:Zn-dependent M16 (insulinase) family peptidase